MEIIKQNYLDKLNNNQKKAIINPEGPCLIVAGAGSGKTKAAKRERNEVYLLKLKCL